MAADRSGRKRKTRHTDPKKWDKDRNKKKIVDNLLRPCADLGLQEDSLIEWRYDVDKQIDHIVLGKGPPGGAWHTFPGGVRSLSPGAWLCLPPHTGVGDRGTGRVPARAVAAYCRRYVHACKLQRYFRSGVVVSSVVRAPRASAPPCHPSCPRAANFWVSGYDKVEGRPFRYLCRRVVVACGGGDRPNTLPAHVSAHATYSLTHVERAVHLLASQEGSDAARAVLVVGSGVSAADAVRLARGAALHVLHVHRAPADSLAKLAPAAYPDYCQVYRMMLDGPSGGHPLYTPYPDHAILEINPATTRDTPLKLGEDADDETLRPKNVKLLNLVTNETVHVTVSLVAALIGSKPDLFFLRTNFDIDDMNGTDNVRNECVECAERKDGDRRACSLANHWHYLKAVVGQSIQSCKSKCLNYSEINGNGDAGCLVPDCVGSDGVIPYGAECECRAGGAGGAGGAGVGVRAERAVDGRANPAAVDRATHELLRARGVYALGPLTADNFVRFIPGGAFAIVAHLHRQIKDRE